MKKFTLSRFVESLEPSVTFGIDAKVKEMQKQGVKVYDLNLGEPDFQTPDKVKLAGIEAILGNKTRYTQVRGMPELLGALCEKFKKENNLIYRPQEVIVCNGAKQALYLAARAVCDMGQEIIILAPYWTSYPAMVRLSGGEPVVVRSYNFRISASDIKNAITSKTKAIMINSPNNPSGIVYALDELKTLAELVLKHKILIISDEIYEKFLYDGARHFSFASLDPKLKDYTLTINGVSKTYSMTGWRIGYCGGPAYIIEKMVDLQSHVSSNACSVSQVAATEAILGDQESVQKMVAEFDKRRQFVCRELENLGIEFIKPEGAYYVFFRVKPKFTSLSFCEKALEDFRVALNPGETFGAPGWVRLSYTVNLDDLKEGVKRIGAIFREGARDG